MKEKVYRQTQFYGKLTTVTCQEYYLLAPLPVPGDDWQLEHQQTWFAVPNEIVDQLKVNGEYHPCYLEPRHIVTSFPTIDPYLRDGWVWTGDYCPDEAVADDQEPTEEDLAWLRDNPITIDDIMVEVAND